ncbi:hypothetical protein Mapa_006221 [Marchantia paleacea]|nr:hypothetical protein Mapa_006221 [Marchantia paleacea]
MHYSFDTFAFQEVSTVSTICRNFSVQYFKNPSMTRKDSLRGELETNSNFRFGITAQGGIRFMQLTLYLNMEHQYNIPTGAHKSSTP